MKNRKLLEKRLRALANGKRLQLLYELRKRKTADVESLAKALHVSAQAVSHHLQMLWGVDIVERRRRGRHVFYRLSLHQEPPVKQILNLL